ncbi:gluconeogenesis factor YvcK family protein [Acetivibrio cellulolyticus]|uniref:gluconeogenesis factor YvcK family protein n=1 Tax=Acetivibrio cellulolyticus TaxID=35830 RepID=UPI0001E2E307|nr:YvcK family protein [Acetivibrio cellulolyticus]
MRLLNLIRFNNKRRIYLLLDLAGSFDILLGMFLVLRYRDILDLALSVILILVGCTLIYPSIRHFINISKSHLKGSSSKISNNQTNENDFISKKMLAKGPKIVVIGGGTGLSTMLRGLKVFSSNLTAIVTVADDGGGSGVLRQDLGMLPPGDIRNCILALADTEPVMEKLLQYRFKDGMLKGQSFGNLFLAAMDGISDSFEEAVKKMSDVLAVTGRVLPVTLQDVKLCAELEDGYLVKGESRIGKHNSFHRGKIKSVYLEPILIKPLQEAIDSILEADMIVLGPGSLYTSIIPNLLVPGIGDAIRKSNAIKAYVCNVMTQPGETEDYSVSDHVKAIEKHSYKGIIEYCIVNSAEIPDSLKKKYYEDGATTVKVDAEALERQGIKVIDDDFVCINNNYIRHDTKRLSKIIINLCENNCTNEEKKDSFTITSA